MLLYFESASLKHFAKLKHKTLFTFYMPAEKKHTHFCVSLVCNQSCPISRPAPQHTLCHIQMSPV